MLNENEVIEYVCEYLERQGYKISQKLRPTQKGIDIIAKHNKRRIQCLVEAKGGTSSRKGSKRYGQPYSQSQVFDRVAKGLYTVLKIRLENAELANTMVALACPDTEWFRKYISSVKPILDNLGIKILLVKDGGRVTTF